MSASRDPSLAQPPTSAAGPRIRHAEESDVAALGELLRLTWHAAYGAILPAEQIERQLLANFQPEMLRELTRAGRRSALLVLEEAGALIGVAHAVKAGWRGAILYLLYVHPGHHGRGIGKALLAAVEHVLPGLTTMDLAVLEPNTRAIEFYRRRGFEPNGPFPDIWGVGVPVLAMRKRLVPAPSWPWRWLASARRAG